MGEVHTSITRLKWRAYVMERQSSLYTLEEAQGLREGISVTLHATLRGEPHQVPIPVKTDRTDGDKFYLYPDLMLELEWKDYGTYWVLGKDRW